MSERATNFSPEELEAFFELSARVFRDYRTSERPFDIVYLFSHTPDNEDSCFKRAIQLVREGATKSLSIGVGEKGHGYEGFDHSLEKLRALGFIGGSVPIVPLEIGDDVNTRGEARALVDYAMKNGLQEIGIVAPPFHIVRAFMTTVSAAAHVGAELRIYPIPGTPLSWREVAVHSQGILKNTRAGLLTDEIKRIEKYGAPEFGSLLPPRKVVEYLNRRDGVH